MCVRYLVVRNLNFRYQAIQNCVLDTGNGIRTKRVNCTKSLRKVLGITQQYCRTARLRNNAMHAEAFAVFLFGQLLQVLIVRMLVSLVFDPRTTSRRYVERCKLAFDLHNAVGPIYAHIRKITIKYTAIYCCQYLYCSCCVVDSRNCCCRDVLLRTTSTAPVALLPPVAIQVLLDFFSSLPWTCNLR